MRTRGLSDLRTATTTRLHAKPPQKGTEYLNLYLLDKEAQRLEQELAGLEHRRKRIHGHLSEIRSTMAKVEGDAHQDRLLMQPAMAGPVQAGQDPGKRRWRRMPVDY